MADLHKLDADGWPAAFWAAERGDEEEAERQLLLAPELAQLRDVRGLGILHVAAWRGRVSPVNKEQGN